MQLCKSYPVLIIPILSGDDPSIRYDLYWITVSSESVANSLFLTESITGFFFKTKTPFAHFDLFQFIRQMTLDLYISSTLTIFKHFSVIFN